MSPNEILTLNFDSNVQNPSKLCDMLELLLECMRAWLVLIPVFNQ